MKKQNELAVIPTADLLTEMETLKILGGIAEINDTYVLGCGTYSSSCNKYSLECGTHTFCGSANCVAGCGCPPVPETKNLPNCDPGAIIGPNTKC